MPLAGYLVAGGLGIAGLAGYPLRRPACVMTAIGAIGGMIAAIDALISRDTVAWTGWAVAGGARFDFRLDPLSAAFLLLISVPALAVSIYLLGEHERDPVGGSAEIAAVALLMAALSVVVLADNVFAFLTGWEAMALLSFLLALGRGGSVGRRRAAMSYLSLSHLATIFLIAAFFGLTRNAGSLDFAVFRVAASSLPGQQRDLIFLAALIGLGAKAGLFPLHFWRPRLYHEIPGPIAALLSAAMAKLAIYALIRLVLEWVAPGPSWWGIVLLLVGSASAILGALYSLVERDMARVLAYSTIEQFGILTIGVGSALMLMASGHQDVAAVAVIAVVLHALNHAVFKTLLFLGAGSVREMTGTGDLERLGGLIKRAPQLSAFVLIGCAAAASLPPLNGFAGEWLLLQSLLGLGHELGTTTDTALAAVVAAGVGLTGALAVVAFVRLFAVGFLAAPRGDATRRASEPGFSQRAATGVLATAVVLLGLGAPLMIDLLRPVAESLTGGSLTVGVGYGSLADAGRLTSSYAPIAAVIGLLLLGVLPWIVGRLIGGPGRERVAPPWICGVTFERRMPYTATAFSKVLRIVFQAVVRAERTIALDTHASPYFVRAVRYEERTMPIYERAWAGFLAFFVRAGRRIRPLQGGSLRAYLTYVFVTLVVVIVLAR